MLASKDCQDEGAKNASHLSRRRKADGGENGVGGIAEGSGEAIACHAVLVLECPSGSR